MRKSAALTLGLAFILWMGLAQARPSFVSEELESDATRLEHNIGQDLGLPAASLLLQLRKDSATAYIAYKRAGTKPEQAAALARLGGSFANREMWRPALGAYRASLDLADIAQVRNIYADMREKHGFRILDYKIDNETASPRACFQFSETLAQAKVDYTPFVTVSGFANAALSSEVQQLCVEGLK
ncbi:MAG: hypothetical protein ACREDA_09040, partial [Methylocella sp.]